MFAPLNVHSYYSLGWGVDSLDQICRVAAESGCQSLALTDTNNLYGLIFFIQTAKSYGLRPIVGAEVVDQKGIRATLLVKSLAGYRNLSHLITNRHLDDTFDLAFQLPERTEGLFILTDHPALLQRMKKVTLDLYAETSPGQPSWNLLRSHGNIAFQ